MRAMSPNQAAIIKGIDQAFSDQPHDSACWYWLDFACTCGLDNRKAALECLKTRVEKLTKVVEASRCPYDYPKPCKRCPYCNALNDLRALGEAPNAL